MIERDLKSIQALKLLRVLCDTAPRRWTARELAGHLDLHPRAVHRYLAELNRYVDLHHDQHYYQVPRVA